MIYRAKKLYRWWVEFGFKGLWLLSRVEKLHPSQIVSLHSRRVGDLYFRGCREDFEVINTVICFKAYEVGHVCWKQGTVVDLGANIGIATRYFLSALPHVQVTAIEPSDENNKIFEANISATGEGRRVKLRKCAVGPDNGNGCLLRHPDGRFDSFKVAFGPLAAGAVGQLVEVMALDQILRELQRPILVKMDVEGMEDILLERRNKWSDFVSRMMIEFHERLMTLLPVRSTCCS
jgi:FkbM family methyltransferase